MIVAASVMAGYSGTPLAKKLGIKENFNIAFVNAPVGFTKLLDLPSGVKLSSRSAQQKDFILFFTRSRRELETKFSLYSSQLNASGMLWISWPKKASGLATDLSENIIRDIGLANGMVDVKVCAIDDVWSGLKFVFRVIDRERLKRQHSIRSVF